MQLKYKANGNYARVGDLINYRECRFTLKEIIPPSALNKFKGMVWLTRCSDAEELNCEWVPEEGEAGESLGLTVETGKTYWNRARNRQIKVGEKVGEKESTNVFKTEGGYYDDVYANGRQRLGDKLSYEDLVEEVAPQDLLPKPGLIPVISKAFVEHGDSLPHADIIRAVLDGKAVRRQYSGIGPAQYVAYSTDAVGQRDAIQAILASPVGEWSLVPPTATSYIPVWGEARGFFSGASYALRSAAVSQRVGGKPPAIILVVTLDENLKVVDSHTEAP